MIKFIHIPKTGGSYIKKNLIDLNKDKIINVGHMFYNSEKFIGKDSLVQINNNFVVDKDKLNKFVYIDGYGKHLNKNDYLFSVIRNPFDMLVSYYSHNDLNINGGWGNCRNIHKIGSFEEFIEKYCDPDFEWHFPAIKNNLYYWIYKNEKEIAVDELLRFENLEEDIVKFCSKFNLKYNSTVIINKSKRKKDYKLYYNPKMVDMINEKLGFILSEYGYEF